MKLLHEVLDEILFIFEIIFSGNYGLVLTGTWFLLVLIVIVFLVKNRKQRVSYLVIRASYVVYMSLVVYYVFLPIPINHLGLQDARMMHGPPIFDARYFLSIIPVLGVFYANNRMSFILNIALFIPYGVYLNMFKQEMTFKRTFIQSLKLSLLIELTQLIVTIGFNFNYRVFDFNDVLANSVGGVIGYLVYRYGICLVYKHMTQQNQCHIMKEQV